MRMAIIPVVIALTSGIAILFGGNIFLLILFLMNPASGENVSK